MTIPNFAPGLIDYVTGLFLSQLYPGALPHDLAVFPNVSNVPLDGTSEYETNADPKVQYVALDMLMTTDGNTDGGNDTYYVELFDPAGNVVLGLQNAAGYAVKNEASYNGQLCNDIHVKNVQFQHIESAGTYNKIRFIGFKVQDLRP